MSRPTGFAELANLNVGVWGFGIEGEATVRRLGSIPRSIVIVDDIADESRGVIGTQHGGLERLRQCDVVLKSPGIPRRRDDVVDLESRGVVLTSALNLWLGEIDRSRVIAITGTKGKSTTTSVITFFLRALGEEAHSAGNFGTPPYDPTFAKSGWVVLEVSSFQSLDLELAPAIIVVTSLGADHLDWHGSLHQYHEDKLSFTRSRGAHTTYVADESSLRDQRDAIGGDVVFVIPNDEGLAVRMGLIGQHNVANVALALAATSKVLGRSVEDLLTPLRGVASSFEPLPGRLTVVGQQDGVLFVDDGLATSPLPTIAALSVFDNEPVALIVGGFDRGVDYTALASAIANRRPPTALVAMPDAGARIVATVLEHVSVPHVHTANMTDAVSAAIAALGSGGGVVLLSPAAPSFGHYANWRERSAEFDSIVAAQLH